MALLEAAFGRLLFFCHQFVERGERPMFRGLRIRLPGIAARLRIDLPCVLVLMTVDAQELPVAAVRRVVVVVAVLVVHGELAQAAGREMAGGGGAHAGGKGFSAGGGVHYIYFFFVKEET